MDRRSLIVGAGVSLTGAFGLPARSFAFTPMPQDNAPYLYRFKIGDSEATVVSDGILPLKNPLDLFGNITKEEIARELRDNSLPLDKLALEQNVLVLNHAGKTIVFDTGMGSLQTFGPTTGKLMSTLGRAGIDPAKIDAVVMSHAHVDHCGGIMADDGTSHFPNAQFYITQADYDFWTDRQKVGPAMEAFWNCAVRNLTPNRDRMHFIRDGEEILPGIHALYAPGHTVGHTIFVISSGNQQLCYIADLAHHPVLLLQHPLTQFLPDTDPALSAQSRLKMLSMLADERMPVLAYHFPWPGIGNIARQGDGFRFLPSPMTLG